MHKFKRFFLSVQGKLLLSFFILLVIPLSIFTFYASTQISYVLQNQTFAAGQKAFTETISSLERLQERVENVMEILSYDPLVYRMSSKNPLDYPYIRQLEDSQALTETFKSLKRLSDVDGIRLYVDNAFLYSKESVNVWHFDALIGKKWFKDLDGTPLWLSPSDLNEKEPMFSYVRRIYDPNHIKEPIAMLRVDVLSEQFAESLEQTQITPNSSLLLMRGGELLLAAGKTIDEAQLPLVADSAYKSAEKTWHEAEIEKEQFYLHHAGLKNTNWTLISVIPRGDITGVSSALRTRLMSVMVLCGAIAYIVAYFVISRGAMSRLTQLEETMRLVETGTELKRTTPSGRDEIGRLMEHYNTMIDRIEQLLEERYEMGIQIKNLELKALQAQINPHFLYNSLDLISCLAISRGIPEITRMVNALVRFYKLSLNQGRDVVPLRDEWAHAKTYIEIQAMRFPDSFTLIENIDPAVLDKRIIKIVLQPIVENALIHGIFEKESKHGTLSVSMKLADDTVVIEIADDGPGMDPETFHRHFDLLDEPDYTTPGGYGVRNIIDRLRLAYGPMYGLECESELGKGTRVIMRIPAIDKHKNLKPDI